MRSAASTWFALAASTGFALAASTFLVGSVGFAASASADASEIGHVTALEGRALAVAPGEARLLDCGDPVHRGERLLTDGNAHVVIATDAGPALQLAPSGALRLGHRAAGEVLYEIERGALRVRDEGAGSLVHVMTPAGSEPLSSSDVEIVRIGPDLRICERRAGGMAACRLVQSHGRANWLEDAAPRLDFAMKDTCGWKNGIRGLYTQRDFVEPAPVSAGPAGDSEFPIDLDDRDPVCGGDDCGVNSPPVPEPVGPGVPELTVAQPPVALPPFVIP